MLGLTGPGQPLAGLPAGFALSLQDIPDEPEDTEAGKDLPDEVMRALCDNLDLLEKTSSREVRVAVELIIDTGRRPDEIAKSCRWTACARTPTAPRSWSMTTTRPTGSGGPCRSRRPPRP